MHRARSRDERGLVSVWAAVSMVAFILIVGLGVDFSGHAGMEQQARSVAAEAARAGGQQLNVDNGKARADVHGAIQAANAYVASSDFSATTRVSSGTIIEVAVEGRYRCRFLSIIGIDSLPVHATGTADVTSVLEGRQQ